MGGAVGTGFFFGGEVQIESCWGWGLFGGLVGRGSKVGALDNHTILIT